MRITPKSTVFLLAMFFAAAVFAQTSSEVAMVSHSTVDVKYKGEENYIAYLNQRGLSKDNIFKEYYTAEFSFDAGKIKAGTVKEITIPFKNVSDNYVKITATNEICDCLVATFPSAHQATFKPGEERIGKVKFSTKGLSGKIRRPIEVRTYTNMKEINYLIWIQAEVVK